MAAPQPVPHPRDAVLTVVFGAVLDLDLYKSFRFVFVTGRWTIIEVNLRLLMVGRYPEVHDLRLAVTVVVLAAWGGLLAGFIRGRQVRAGRITADDSKLSLARVSDLVERLWIPLAVVVLLLLLSATPGPWIMVGTRHRRGTRRSPDRAVRRPAAPWSRSARCSSWSCSLRFRSACTSTWSPRSASTAGAASCSTCSSRSARSCCAIPLGVSCWRSGDGPDSRWSGSSARPTSS